MKITQVTEITMQECTFESLLSARGLLADLREDAERAITDQDVYEIFEEAWDKLDDLLIFFGDEDKCHLTLI